MLIIVFYYIFNILFFRLQVADARRMVEEAKVELESHKVKRMQARNEMVSMAETLEKAQKEADIIKGFLADHINPTVYDQINSLEHLLHNVEKNCSKIASKRMVQLQTHANDFLAKRFKKNERRGSGSRGVGLHGPGSPLGGSSSGVGLDSSLTSTGGRSKSNAGAKFSAGPSIPSLTEALEQVDILRGELDRIKAGIALLSQSIQRLDEVVNIDTSCCGGLFEYITLTAAAYLHEDSVSASRRAGGRGSNVYYDRVSTYANEETVSLASSRDEDTGPSILYNQRNNSSSPRIHTSGISSGGSLGSNRFSTGALSQHTSPLPSPIITVGRANGNGSTGTKESFSILSGRHGADADLEEIET